MNAPLKQTDIDKFALRMRDDFLYYAPRALRLKPKQGGLVPFRPNFAQEYVHRLAQDQLKRMGKVRIILLKGRQQGMCLAPDTRVLMADLTWRRIADVQPGEEVVACDETPQDGSTRKMRTASVEAVARFRKPLYRITLHDGTHIDCTDDHRWLTRKSQTQADWRTIAGGKGRITVGTHIRSVTDPWPAGGHEDGWFGGIIDGEGSFSTEKEAGASVRVCQRAGPVWDRIQAYLDERGYEYTYNSDNNPARRSRFGGTAIDSAEVSQMSALFRLVGQTRPSRAGRFWEGRRLPNNGWKRVVSIEPLGMSNVVDLQTSEKTFIAEGLVSHNSTYIEGRFYWLTTHRFGIKAYILTHEAEATKNLFEMAFRYWENCPPEFKPAIDAGNAKELSFGVMDTKYSVGTAGAKGTGRSQNIHLFHGSEVAYWPHANDHASGVMQAVGDFPGTEIWLESTASGPGDYFHSTWQGATDPGKEPQATANDFLRVFIPWYWQEEYRMEVKPGFVLDADEVELMDTYGLDFEQLQWRRTKIQDLGGDVARFQRDYPMNPDEAFQNATINTLIPTLLVIKARRRKNVEAYGPRLLGVDVAREGDDRSALALRQGRVVPWIKTYSNKDNMELVGLVTKAVREYGVDHIFCDGVGNGSGVIDRLRELGYGHMLTAIKGNHKPLDPVLYYNKRAECWGRMKVWLEEDDPALPDDADLQADLCGLTKTFDSSERMVLEKKSAAKKRGIKSPDMGDALAFTFAQPVGTSNNGSFEPEDVAT